MKINAFFVILLFVGFYSSNVLAQKVLSEADKLSFETSFFEALKQKAIGNFDKAVEALDVCIAIDSANVAVLFERSKNFYWQKNYFEAKQNLQKALKLEPTNIWLLEHAKDLAVAAQNYAEAIGFQKQIITLNPLRKTELLSLYVNNHDTKNALNLLNIIKKERGLNKQLKKIEHQLLEPEITQPNIVNDSNTNNLEGLKTAYQKLQNYDLLKQILALESEQKLYEMLNQEVTNALEIFPSQALLYLYAAEANNALKNYQTALEHLENGIDFAIDKLMKKKYYLAYFESYKGLNNMPKANEYQKRASQL